MDVSQSSGLNTVNDPIFGSSSSTSILDVFNGIGRFFRYLFGSSSESSFNWDLVGDIYNTILAVLSIFFITLIAYCYVRLKEIRAKEAEHFKEKVAEYARKQAEKEGNSIGDNGKPRNKRWETVLAYLASVNPSDWKLAVLEADSMLEELTDELQFEGEDLGERLKGTNRDKFRTLDDAWEAHLIRNRIAHEGLKFDLTQREANRVVMLYENVFREFGYI